MTTDIAVLERAVVVMAICMAVQTLLFIAAAVAGVNAWRRTTEALVQARLAAEAQIAEMHRYLDRISANVDAAARGVVKGTAAVDHVMTDVRDAMGTVSRSVGTMTSVVTAPRTALAVGVWQGYQYWRKRRAAQRMTEAATSEL